MRNLKRLSTEELEKLCSQAKGKEKGRMFAELCERALRLDPHLVQRKSYPPVPKGIHRLVRPKREQES